MEITKSLHNIVRRTRGINHLYLTDRDGIPMIGVNRNGEEDVSGRVQLINCNQLAVEQIGKLNLGEQKSAIFCYETFNVVLLSIKPVMVLIIASSEVSVGTLLDLRRSLEPVVTEITKITSVR